MESKEAVDAGISECLRSLGLGNCKVVWTNCTNVVKINGPGAYIFVRDNSVFYVGEANDVARRVSNEHCKARIGASEGVVRFLMYLLDEVCRQADDWRGLTVVDRENYIRENILMPMIRGMEIIVITCPQLKDPVPRKKNEVRLKLEKCLIDHLKPRLQQ